MSNITYQIRIDELCLNAGICQEAIVEVVEYGIATPIEDESIAKWAFDIESALWIKKAVKLSQELHLDWVATAMIIELMKTKQQLEKENSQLKARLNR